MASYDIEMTTDDTLELDAIIKAWNAKSNSIVNVTDGTEGTDFNLDGIQTNTAIFDPINSGTYNINVNGQELTVKVNKASAIPDSGISRYEFEDSGQFSTLVDDRANNNGTLNNGTYVTGGVEFANSSDNYGTLPNTAFNFSGAFSVAVRLSVSSEFGSSGASTISRQSHIGSRDSSRGEGFSIEHRNGNVEMGQFDGTNANTVQNSTDLRDGNEHLLVMAFGQSQYEGFVDDGSSIGTNAYDGDISIPNDVGVARRGGGGGGDRQGPMTALDVQTFDKRLSSSEVSNLFNTGSIKG